jgi:hypothetical protein
VLIGSWQKIGKLWKQILGSLVFAGVFVVFSQSDYPGTSLLLPACIAYSIGYSILMRKYLLRAIGPEMLIFWSMLLLYLGISLGSLLLVVIASETLILSIIGFVSDSFDQALAVRLLYYILYLGVVILVGYNGFALVKEGVHMATSNAINPTLTPIAIFLAGTATTNVAIHAAYLYTLLPERGDDAASLKDKVHLYAERYQPDPKKTWEVRCLLVGVGIILLANLLRHTVNDGILLSVLLSISHLLGVRAAEIDRTPAAAASQL